jgi:CubicO group peptidase (beta-lactamase class C family)
MNRFSSRLVLSLSLLASIACGNDWPLRAVTPAAASLSAPRLERMHEQLGREISAGRYAGYVVLLARDGKLVDWCSHGWLDVATQRPMPKDAIVRIYSMSKIVTSVAVMMLMEEGRLRLSDPVEKYLPALKARQVYMSGTADAPVLAPATRAMTVSELLAHTAGYYYAAPWSADPVPAELMLRAKLWEASNLDDFVQRLAAVPLHQQPGTKFRYGIHTDLLGAIVEKIAGERIDRFFQTRIFEPLGMKDTAFWVPAEKRERMASLYASAGGKLSVGEPLVAEPTAERGLLSPGGGLHSTAGDYVRFAQMLLDGGQLEGARILSRKTVELMTQNRLTALAEPHPFGQKELGFGLGVRIVTNLGASRHLGSPGMFGWDGAATTLVWMDPKERLVSILLTQHFPYNEGDIFATFMNGVYGAITD